MALLSVISTPSLSVTNVAGKLMDLVEVGVVWPSGLFVLLDDMEMRGVRTF
jgi:hypothetical protein